jgi:RNA 2',3'-cyclic 3'-phosphodiesterase
MTASVTGRVDHFRRLHGGRQTGGAARRAALGTIGNGLEAHARAGKLPVAPRTRWTVRLFVALELDEKAKDLLADIQQRLATLDRAVRWVQPGQIHLTLQFLGEVPDARVPQVAKALDRLAEHAAFDFEIEGVGTFGSPRSPRVIWVGVRMPNPPLADLQKACETCLADLEFAPEGRTFKPHLTLGRVKDFRAGRQIIEAVEGLGLQTVGRLVQAAEEVILFESILQPRGSLYVAVHKILLRKG